MNPRCDIYLILFKFPPKGGGTNHTPLKSPEDSPLTYDESEDLSFLISKLEDMIKGCLKTIDLLNLEERMGHMENMMEENMKILLIS